MPLVTKSDEEFVDNIVHIITVIPTEKMREEVNEEVDHAMVAETHMAIRSRSYRQLVDDYLAKASNPQHLLWQTNQLGWMAIHVAASCHDIPIEWWEYLLHQAGSCCNCSRCNVVVNQTDWSSQRCCLTNCRTSLGFSTIDLFFKTWLDPFPWQRDHLPSSQRLGQVMSEIRSSDEMLQEFRRCLQQQRQQRRKVPKQNNDIAAGDGPSVDSFDDVSSDPIKEVAQFWYRMEILMRRAGCTTDVPLHHGCSQSYNLLCMLAHTGCPKKIVTQLALRMVQVELAQIELGSFEPGLLPIHIWARSKEHGPDRWTTTSDDDDDGVLEALLEVWPEAASVASKGGQLPLHSALAQGKSWKRLRLLFSSYPDALWTLDQTTALPSFCLAVLAVHETRERASLCARQTVGNKIGGMWHFLPLSTQQQAIDSAQQLVDAEQLTTIYEVLRAFPNAVLTALSDDAKTC